MKSLNTFAVISVEDPLEATTHEKFVRFLKVVL